jgi:phosphohistidine phosphatase
MEENGYLPQVVLSSASRRTRETWALVESVLGVDCEVRFQRSLYHADASGLLMEIHVQTNGVDRLMILGHNPGIGDLAVYLTGAGDPDSVDRMSRKFPTGALAVLEYRGEQWAGLSRGSCRLVEFVRPRDL